jgi:hypothetical protein
MCLIRVPNHLGSLYPPQIAAGLAVSIALTLISLPLTVLHGRTGQDNNFLVDGAGMLHAIWMYRNHPELEMLLEQVEYPTEANLREAGMIETTLVGHSETTLLTEKP